MCLTIQTQRKVDVATLKDEISKLKSQIVESPEELKTEMERMKESVKSIKMSKVCMICMLHTFVYMSLLDNRCCLIAQISRSLFCH